MFRYTIVLVRNSDSDYGPEQKTHENDDGGYHDGSDESAIAQVAAELQQAMDETGLPVGFFRVIKRERIEGDLIDALEGR